MYLNDNLYICIYTYLDRQSCRFFFATFEFHITFIHYDHCHLNISLSHSGYPSTNHHHRPATAAIFSVVQWYSHSTWHRFRHSLNSGIFGIYSDILSGILSDIISGVKLRSGSAHWDLAPAVEVRQCPLKFDARGWGPAVPTNMWSSWLRSGSAHWDLGPAVEVWQCPLPGARG